jgi:hypothetical protein
MKRLFVFAIIALGVIVSSCNTTGENPVFDRPLVAGPENFTKVQVDTEVTINFIVEAAGKIASLAVTASDGSASIVDAGSHTGSTNATVAVSYTAPSVAGSQIVTLTVTDQQNPAKSATGTTTVDVTTSPPPPANEIMSGELTVNQTWTADRIWELAAKVIVPEGLTLTIEPGTIIKGRTGTGSLATALIVARGGKIMASGTVTAPIIFTSVEDNIAVGQLAGSNLTFEDKEKWGGLIILGNAPISAENGDTEAQIEGIPAEETYGLYGGSATDDNSGILQYVSIRHGGALIGEGNEINGLTLGGVGSGTLVDYLEVYATLDDGIEFFGGTLNVSNALVTYQGDDGLDIDQNYAGTVDNFVVFHGGTVTDEGLEIDGPEGTTHTDGLFTLRNGLVKSLGGDVTGSPADLKSKAQGTIDNVVFANYITGKDLLKIRASYTNNCADAKTDAFTHLTEAMPLLNILNSNQVGVSVYTKSVAIDAITSCDVKSADQTAAMGAVNANANATGADITVFANWTATSLAGILQ